MGRPRSRHRLATSGRQGYFVRHLLLTAQTFRASRSGGKLYGKQNALFWARRTSGLAILLMLFFPIVKEVLGEEWLNNGLFRLGTSRLANLLLSEIKGEEMKFF